MEKMQDAADKQFISWQVGENSPLVEGLKCEPDCDRLRKVTTIASISPIGGHVENRMLEVPKFDNYEVHPEHQSQDNEGEFGVRRGDLQIHQARVKAASRPLEGN